MIVYHDITLKLMYIARDKAWRLYTDSGQYYPFKGLDDLPRAVATLLCNSAKETEAIFKEKAS